MKTAKAFSLVEIMVVLAIMGIVLALSIPLIVTDTKNKISNTQYYAAYKALYEGSKRAKLLSSTHDFSVTRATSAQRMGVCDLFTQIFSIIDSEVNNLEMRTCPEGNIDFSTGLCDTCTYVSEDTECPMDKHGKRIKYCDKDCSVGCDDKGSYCRIMPVYTKYYFQECDDGTVYAVTENETTKFVPRTKNLKNNKSSYNDTLNFNDIATGNFTTANGLTFYGLEKYPANYKRPNFRNVYIDTNGRSDKYAPECPACGTNSNSEIEAKDCEKTLECLRKNYGVYKFRLYDDGYIEPMTNRSNTKTKMLYKLYYVQNGKIKEAPSYFNSYEAARKYRLETRETFNYYESNDLTTPVLSKKVLQQPCYKDEDYAMFKCDIIPVVPDLSLSKSSRIK